jgi:hypothetical protein
MTNGELIEEIKAQGYWRVEFHSTEYQAKRLPTRASMEALISSATVSLRGWPYPYYQANETAYPGGQWLEGKVAWESYREYWRLYESGRGFIMQDCTERAHNVRRFLGVCLHCPLSMLDISMLGIYFLA